MYPFSSTEIPLANFLEQYLTAPRKGQPGYIRRRSRRGREPRLNGGGVTFERLWNDTTASTTTMDITKQSRREYLSSIDQIPCHLGLCRFSRKISLNSSFGRFCGLSLFPRH